MPFGCFIGDGEQTCAWRRSPVVSGHLFVDSTRYLEDAAGGKAAGAQGCGFWYALWLSKCCPVPHRPTRLMCSWAAAGAGGAGAACPCR